MEEEVKDIGSIPTLLPQLTALEIHNNILRCHRLGSRVHRTMLEWLWALIEKDDWVDLGSGGPMSYVVKQLGYGRSEASDILGVARKLHEIPLSVTAFDEGRISWDKLKAIASVAKPGKEAAWLERAERQGREEPDRRFTDRLARQHALIKKLRGSPDRPNISQLARHFQVSRKTIIRDVRDLILRHQLDPAVYPEWKQELEKD